jgi:hypothetical protein
MPTDGSTLTQALLTDLIVALGNRIEFLRDLSLEASDTPEAYCTLREDFLGAIYNSGQSRLDADYLWRTSELGSPSVNHANGSAKNPGQLSLALPPGGSGGDDDHGLDIYLGSTSTQPFSFATVETLTVVVKVTEDPANLNATTQFGFVTTAGTASQNGGTNCVQIGRNVALDVDDWYILRRVAGVQTLTLLTGGTFSDGEFHVWRIEKQTSGDWQILLNGALVHTIAAADLPSGACNLRLYAMNSVADPELTGVTWDQVVLRTKPDDRSGA